jgi:hypothetical protein
MGDLGYYRGTMQAANGFRNRLLPWFGPLSAAAFLFAAAPPAAAVPIPYHNCGKAGDILSVQLMDASVWPPPTAAPLAAMATFDPATGQLTNLRVFLLFGADWVFDSGSLPTGLGSGFVLLPASVPMSVTSPPLPLAAGPYSLTHTFTSPDGSGASVVVNTKANVGQAISGPLTTLSLTFNGTPGFPVPPVPGAYEARVQMTLPSGAEVFCFDLTLTDLSFVSVAPPQIPILSWYGRLALLVLLAGCGVLALRRSAG